MGLSFELFAVYVSRKRKNHTFKTTLSILLIVLYVLLSCCTTWNTRIKQSVPDFPGTIFCQTTSITSYMIIVMVYARIESIRTLLL